MDGTRVQINLVTESHDTQSQIMYYQIFRSVNSAPFTLLAQVNVVRDDFGGIISDGFPYVDLDVEPYNLNEYYIIAHSLEDGDSPPSNTLIFSPPPPVNVQIQNGAIVFNSDAPSVIESGGGTPYALTAGNSHPDLAGVGFIDASFGTATGSISPTSFSGYNIVALYSSITAGHQLVLGMKDPIGITPPDEFIFDHISFIDNTGTQQTLFSGDFNFSTHAGGLGVWIVGNGASYFTAGNTYTIFFS